MGNEENKIINEVLESRRSFFGGDGETEYFIGSPTAEDIRGADWQYSKKYTKCLIEGIPTSAELSDILRRRGVIGEDFDRRAEELTTILNELLMRLAEASNNEEKTSLAYEVAQARENLFQWNQRLSGPMSNTCEQISDDVRLEYLTSCMLQDKNGEKIWGSYEDFLSEVDRELTLKARYEVMLYLQGYDSDFLSNTPEAKAMQEVQDDLLKEIDAEKDETSTKSEEDLKPKEEPKPKSKAKPKAKKTKGKKAEAKTSKSKS